MITFKQYLNEIRSWYKPHDTNDKRAVKYKDEVHVADPGQIHFDIINRILKIHKITPDQADEQENNFQFGRVDMKTGEFYVGGTDIPPNESKEIASRVIKRTW